MNPEQSWTAQDSQDWQRRMDRDRATRERAIRMELNPADDDRGFTRMRPRTVLAGVVLGICGWATLTGFWTWAWWLVAAARR